MQKKFMTARNIFIILILLFYSSVVAQNNNSEWQTSFEKSNYLKTENYSETIGFFQRLADNSTSAELITFGKSPQGRKLVYLIAASNQEFSVSKAKQSHKPIILIENGIHAGEIEGKDACMLLLRDILITKINEHLLDSTIILIVPIFNVDGHERSGKYNRINQNGPENMGWRVNARNLNLNRDFMKADTPEMRALLKLYNEWLPDFFIDTHTTDGADYQYTITYGLSTHKNMPDRTAEWLSKYLIPKAEKYVKNKGFLISPYVGYINGDFRNGIRDWIPGPRYSNGYANVQNRPGLLIETHMLKPYKQRVFATKALLEAVILYSGRRASELTRINKLADEDAILKYSLNHAPYPLKINVDLNNSDSNFYYKGINFIMDSSKIAGAKIKRYTGEKLAEMVPYYKNDIITASVILPKEYYVPAEWNNIIKIMKVHGINVTRSVSGKKAIVEKYKFKNVKFKNFPYEGRFEPEFEYDIVMDTVRIPKGTYIVKTNQRTVGVIAHLLEPKSQDSFLSWGFFNAIFERKEYFEMYSMEPIALKMYNTNLSIKKLFDSKVLEDTNFRNDPRLRLDFFYRNSPYYDQQHNYYPVMRKIRLLDN